MPTKPFEPLLYREYAKVDAKELIDLASPLLQELVNNGTNVFMRCQAEAGEGEADEHVPVFTLYLHVLEMTDGIEVLISQSCANAAIPLVRSSFEATLAMEYIMESDYRQRAFAWMASNAHNRMRYYESVDPSTLRYKQLAKELLNDKVMPQINLPPAADPAAAVDDMRKLLAEPQYKRAEAEYQSEKKRTRRTPQWFSLFGGSANLRDLAVTLGRGAEYEYLYRYWSSIAHGVDITRFLTPTDSGEPGIYPLRNARDLPQIALFASHYLLDATTLLIRKFRPGEDISRWYKREVRTRFLKLSRTKVRVNLV